MRILLSRLESDIIRHRLEVGDAIASCLCDGFDLPDYKGWHPEDVEECCAILLRSIDGPTLNLSDALGQLPVGMVQAVLADCVEGSTYFGASKNDESNQQLAGIIRAGHRLEAKIGEYVGCQLVFPTY